MDRAKTPAVSAAALDVVADLAQAFGRVTPMAMRGRVSKAVGMLLSLIHI